MSSREEQLHAALAECCSDILKTVMEAMADPEGGIGADQIEGLIRGHLGDWLSQPEQTAAPCCKSCGHLVSCHQNDFTGEPKSFCSGCRHECYAIDATGYALPAAPAAPLEPITDGNPDIREIAFDFVGDLGLPEHRSKEWLGWRTERLIKRIVNVVNKYRVAAPAAPLDPNYK